MITKQRFSVTTLVTTGLVLLFNTASSYAQTYPGATVTASSTTHVINAAQAGGNDLSNAARINAALSVPVTNPNANNHYVQLTWANTAAAGTPVYIKVNAETALLSGVLGGALGNLTNTLTNLLLDGQYITVTAYNGTTAGNSGIVDANLNNDSSTVIKVIQDAAGNYFIRFVPSAAFNGIRITNTRSGTLGLLTTKWLDVYGAFHSPGVNGCTVGNYTSYTGAGLVSADLAGNAAYANGFRAIDADGSTYSTLSIGTAGALKSAEQQFYFEGTNTATDTYNVKMRLTQNLVDIGLLNRIAFVGYNSAGTQTYTAAFNTLISAELLTLLQNNQPVNFSFAPGQAFSKVGIRITGAANVTLAQQLDIYSVTKGNFTVGVTGGGIYNIGDTVTLTATPGGCSEGSYTYSWSGGLGNAATATPSTTTPGATTYTVTVTDSFGIQRTGTTTVVVLPNPGTINGGGAICYNETSGNLTLTGYTGNILRWEKSTDAAFTSPVTIANTTATLTGAEIGTLTATTYIRAVVGATGTPETYATTALTVTTTTWTTNGWDNGTPDITTRVFINANYSQAENLSACTIDVGNNAIVSIPTGYTVTINGYLNVNAGSTFTLEHNAHLVQITDAANVGNITMKRNSNQLFRLDYTLWSSPLVGLPNQQTLRNFSLGTSNNRFYEYKYDTPDNGATYNEGYWPVDPLTTYFEQAKAYLIRMPNSNSTPGYNTGETAIVHPGIFTGVPANGPVSKALSTVGDKYTAIGNPYPSPINVQDFFDANQSVMEPGSVLYFWRKRNNFEASSYATLSRDAYVSNQAVGGNAGEEVYGGAIWNSFFNEETAPEDWVINPGQGFIIQTKLDAASANATFNNAMRRDVHNPQFFRTAAPNNSDLKSRYWLNITGESLFSQMAVVYSTTATTGIDAGRDAQSLATTANLKLYSIAVDKDLAVQARPQFEISDVVAIGYNAPQAGQYTISIHRKDGIFDGQDIYLKDKYEGVTRKLTGNDYSFSTGAGVVNDRFEIVYTTAALGAEVPVATQSNVIVYKNDNTIAVNAGSLIVNSIQVFDMRGRMLFSASDINKADYEISALNSQAQVLLVQVNTSSGSVTKKIIY